VHCGGEQFFLQRELQVISEVVLATEDVQKYARIYRWMPRAHGLRLLNSGTRTLEIEPRYLVDYHLLGDDNHHSHRRGNLKSYKIFSSFDRSRDSSVTATG
jgi:hypothetical protein